MTATAEPPVRVRGHGARAAAPAGPRPGPWGRVRDYVALTKPRIIELLLVTTVPTMVVAAQGLPDAWLVAATLTGGALAAGSANAFNSLLERDIDAAMRRTAGRPLPRHAVAPARAAVFAVRAGRGVVRAAGAGGQRAGGRAGAGRERLLRGVYTLGLKRRTAQNIVIGGAAGCAPVLVAWAAVTGTVALPAWVLFTVIFLWTPPHFWALALRYREDYAAAGVPMLPVVAGERATGRQILGYAFALVACSLVFVPAADAGVVYLACALVLGARFIHLAWRLQRVTATGGEVGDPRHGPVPLVDHLPRPALRRRRGRRSHLGRS